ncbi:hypothetical protein HN018_13105 [Lichenicola cladoniae]|uniref:Uncharacterized protein n=2 Tax=Lichenicola cladoniae TaxID=1484109 RepID=A0A6M8HVL2_9PROT|nr:hypothetical protein [Acetobacteraceae bacterium]QKE92639.1 hypothetical protein HN018_13105 [Lichenicola cladoniae]
MTRFHACDEGSMQEGSSDSVGRILADSWQTLPQLANEIVKEPKLRGFVLAHINGTLDTAQIQKIQHYATTACPKTDELLCKQIAGAAHEALN